MSDWQEIRLKTLISEMGDGGTPTTSEEGNFGGNIPWVVVEDVIPEIYKTKEYLTEKGFKRCSAKLWNEETVILTTGATIGNVGIAKVKLCTKQGITGIVCNEFTDNYYLKFWFEANINQLLRYAQGTTFKEIRTRALGNLKIKIPNPYSRESVSEQRTIASMLSKVDEAIAAAKNSIVKAERLKKALLQNLLTGKLKPDGTWRKKGEFQETVYGLVAKDWRYCKIQDLIKDGIITGVQDGNHGESHPVAAEFVNEGIPFIMASDISSGFIDFTSCKFITFERAEKLRIGFSIKEDVLLSHKASMGFTAIVPDVHPYIMLTPQVTYYRCNKEKLLPEYLHFFFQTYKFQKLFETYSAQTTRNFMGITNQKKLYVFLPDTIEEQEQLIKPIKEVDKTLALKYGKIKKLEHLKKALMQNLLTGKVRVKVPKEATV